MTTSDASPSETAPEETPAQAPAETPPQEPAEALPQAPEETPPQEPTGWTPEKLNQAKATAAQFRAHLGEGRKLTRAGEYQGAVAAFQEALKIQPSDPRALCELGWAAFNGDDLDTAESSLRRSVHRLSGASEELAATSSHKNLVGGCLYNLGRVVEKRGETAEAIEHYKRSLEVRPNKVVEARLAELTAKATAAPSGGGPLDRENDVFLAPIGGAQTSLDSVKRAAVRDVLSVYDREPGMDVRASVAARQTSEEGPLFEVVVLDVVVLSWSAEDWYYVAGRTEAGWSLVGPIFQASQGGVAGESGESEVTSLELRELLAEPGPEALVKLSSYRTDTDLGISEYDETASKTLVLCGLSGQELICATPLRYGYSYVRELFEGSTPDPRYGTPGLPIRRGWELDVTFPEPGRISITKVSGFGEPDSVGTHAITTLRCPPWAPQDRCSATP